MSLCSVHAHQRERGPVLSLVITFMKISDDTYYKEIPLKNFTGLAVVKGILRSGKIERNVIELIVGSKKDEDAKNLTVSLNISSEGTTKQFFCQNEWAEVPIMSKSCHDFHYGGKNRIDTYIIKVDITVHVPVPVAPTMGNLLYEDTEFTDFKLQAKDGVVAFHKSVLFVHSEMFRTMLRGEWKENAESNMTMNVESVQTLQHLKDFMYLGTVPDEGLESLLLLARRSLMDNLVAACVEKLISAVKPETFDALAEFASNNNIVELVRAFARIPDVTGIRWFQ